MAFGSGIPITIDTDYHHKVEEGTTRATVAGDDTIEGVNHDRDAVQTRNVVKDKHVRVFLPLPNLDRFNESWQLIKETYFKPGEKPDFDGFKQALYGSMEAEAEDSNDPKADKAESLTLGFLGEEDSRLVHMTLKVGDDEHAQPTIIEEIVDLNARSRGPREISTTYNHALDVIEIVYVDDAVTRRAVMPGDVFRANMLGASHGGGLMFSDVVHDVEGYATDNAERASHYGFEFADHAMEDALSAFDDRVESYGPVNLSTSEWLDIIFSREVACEAVKGVGGYAVGIGKGLLNAVKAPIEFLELYTAVTGLAVEDPDAFNQATGELIKFLSKEGSGEVIWNAAVDGVIDSVSTPKGIGEVSGETLAGLGFGHILKNFNKVTKAFSVLKQRNVVKRTADEVNDAFREIADKKHYDSPYKPGTAVHEFELAKDTVFARLFPDGGRVASDWLVASDEIAGLTRAQIKDKLSLPKLPDNIVEVHVPKGTKMRTGEVNPLFGGKGGGVQFELMQGIPERFYKNIKKIGE